MNSSSRTVFRDDRPSRSYGSIPEIINNASSDDETIDNTLPQRPLVWTRPATVQVRRMFSTHQTRRPFLACIIAATMIMVGLVLKAPSTLLLPNTITTATATAEHEDSTGQHEYISTKTFLLDEAYDSTPLYYDDQKVDHLHSESELRQLLGTPNTVSTYSQRYYKISKYFQGPGHPILVIMGGEAALELPMLYPFVHDALASTFGAFVVSPEHRFYGNSQPVNTDHPSVPEMMAYLSPDQALEDAIQLIGTVRHELGCNPDRTHPDYCPVITFGGSYPGFLSAMLRFRYPDLVDGSYASSAPLELYSQQVDSAAYFDKITEVADVASEGCSASVRSTLYALRDELYSEFGENNNVLDAATAVGFCPSTFPSYIESIEEFVSEAIQYLVPAIFADFNMAYYPPGPETDLSRACAVFQEEGTSPMEKIRNFFKVRGGSSSSHEEDSDDDDDFCYDISLEIPDGDNAKIRGPDNSGGGVGPEGRIWEFQCCKDLVIGAGYSEESMFLPRPFSYQWHEEHCTTRFPGISVEPYRMKQQWGFDNLTTTSRIIFANGLDDGWSTSSITNATEVSEAHGYHEISVLNFPNGAHHSELKGGPYPNPNDTDDILEGYQTATEILSGWLDEIVALQ